MHLLSPFQFFPFTPYLLVIWISGCKSVTCYTNTKGWNSMYICCQWWAEPTWLILLTTESSQLSSVNPADIIKMLLKILSLYQQRKWGCMGSKSVSASIASPSTPRNQNHRDTHQMLWLIKIANDFESPVLGKIKCLRRGQVTKRVSKAL